MNEKHNPWKILSSHKVYDNKWINVTEYQVLNPSGNKGIYGKVHFKNQAIGIVPLDKEFNTYLVGQYRFTIDEYSWEIPEGGCPFNEKTITAAQRELLEETGLKANKWTKLMNIHTSNSVTDERGEIFLARELSQHTSSPEETEQLAVKKVPLEKVIEMIDEGKITDSITIAAIYKVKLMMLNGEL